MSKASCLERRRPAPSRGVLPPSRSYIRRVMTRGSGARMLADPRSATTRDALETSNMPGVDAIAPRSRRRREQLKGAAKPIVTLVEFFDYDCTLKAAMRVARLVARTRRARVSARPHPSGPTA